MTKTIKIETLNKMSEAQALAALVGFAREDVEQGDTLSSVDFKEKLRKRKEALKKVE